MQIDDKWLPKPKLETVKACLDSFTQEWWIGQADMYIDISWHMWVMSMYVLALMVFVPAMLYLGVLKLFGLKRPKWFIR